MPGTIDPKRLTGPWNARLLLVATLVSAVVAAACSGGGTAMTAANTGPATGSTSSTGTGGAATSSQAAAPADSNDSALAFARCMRASGVPNFPDPSPGGGFLFSATGLNLSSPAARAAQAKCQKLLPGGGPPRPGTHTHPTAQTLATLLGIARCMREHGVPDFPDPMTSVPSNPFPGGAGVITDYDDAILLFPSTLNMDSPAYTHATATCGVLSRKLGRGPHG
jgi:hypothetical protein